MRIKNASQRRRLALLVSAYVLTKAVLLTFDFATTFIGSCIAKRFFNAK